MISGVGDQLTMDFETLCWVLDEGWSAEVEDGFPGILPDLCGYVTSWAEGTLGLERERTLIDLLPKLFENLNRSCLTDDRELFMRLHTQLFPTLLRLSTVGAKEALQNPDHIHSLETYLSLLCLIFDVDNYHLNHAMMSPEETKAQEEEVVGEWAYLSEFYREIRSVFLVHDTNHFGKLGGFKLLEDVITTSKNLVLMSYCLKLFGVVVTSLNPDLKHKMAHKFFLDTVEALKGLDDDTFKSVSLTLVVEVISHVKYLMRVFPIHEVNQVIDEFSLDWALRCFKSNYIEKKLQGLMMIESKVLSAQQQEGADWRHGNNHQWITPTFIIQWLKENKIVESLFNRKDAHEGLVKKSNIILEFLAKKNELTSDNIDAIWDCSQDKYLGPITCEVLKSIAYQIHDEVATSIWKKIRSLPTSEWTVATIHFVYDFYTQVSIHNKVTFEQCWRVLDNLIDDDSDASTQIIDEAVAKMSLLISDTSCEQRLAAFKMYINRIKDDKDVVQAVTFLYKAIKEFTCSSDDNDDDDEAPFYSRNIVMSRERMVSRLDQENELVLGLVYAIWYYKEEVGVRPLKLLERWKNKESDEKKKRDGKKKG
eukprot:TRINITY_DN1629_c0_g1_i3.p1 TRINITY_DN1629_c0_g1~~TRINITY_DN1629_c0_g1_i3.p1  ORF type:complete len:594 (-),score=110.82 TRINITY_DN1629_c0_g1_i3:44-1825(-)